MPSGLVALLDDIAGLTRLAAASLDDVGAAATKAGTKAAGVVIDDTAVTPRYVVGLSPQRELPIIGKIALGSLRNKLLILLPAALVLSALAPWAITPLLMAGGAYLCFEGTEKVIEALTGHGHDAAEDTATTPEELEKQKVAGAVRTDFILSAEIMAIALGEVAASPIVTRGIVLAIVAVAITAGVYGVVALIVKADDVGLHLAGRRSTILRAIGRGLVRGVPKVMSALSVIGTAAMIWVGGGILLHGAETLGLAAPARALHDLAEAVRHALGGIAAWIVTATGSGLVGLIVGGLIALAVHQLAKARPIDPSSFSSVIPANAGNQGFRPQRSWPWVLTFVRMTTRVAMAWQSRLAHNQALTANLSYTRTKHRCFAPRGARAHLHCHGQSSRPHRPRARHPRRCGAGRSRTSHRPRGEGAGDRGRRRP